MTRLGRVLAATDGRETAAVAVVTGGALARRAGARFSVVGVVETLLIPMGYTPPEVKPPEYEDRYAESMREKAVAQARDAGFDEDVVTLRSGIPESAIVQAAEELDADLLVLAAHPQPAAVRFLVGSTAERVMRMAHRPVLVAVEARRDPFRRVLAAVDLSNQSAPVLAAAAAIAGPDGAALRALHVREPLPAMLLEVAEFDEEKELERARARLDAAIHAAELASGLSPEPRLREGPAGREILEEASGWDADLVVVGTHGFGFLERMLLGSTSLHVLRHGHRATVVVPPTAQT